jgi:dTDP-4-dehydrorhamnose 3,5-epimerase
VTAFDIWHSRISGLKVIERKPIVDARGFLERMYCDSELEEILGGRKVKQINRSLTRQTGTVRGLHFQRAPNAEMKLVSCMRGEVFDVAVDLRLGSPTFLKWHGEVLGESNRRTLVIPEGFAHGFQALSADCELLYLHTAEYVREAEGGFNAADPGLGISWPLPFADQSNRDEQLPFVSDGFKGITA